MLLLLLVAKEDTREMLDRAARSARRIGRIILETKVADTWYIWRAW